MNNVCMSIRYLCVKVVIWYNLFYSKGKNIQLYRPKGINHSGRDSTAIAKQAAAPQEAKKTISNYIFI